jgi:hypothetical protein
MNRTSKMRLGKLVAISNASVAAAIFRRLFAVVNVKMKGL